MFLKPRLFVVMVAALFVVQSICFADAESIQARMSGETKLMYRLKPQCTFIINAEWRKALQDRIDVSPRQAAFEGYTDNYRSVLDRQSFIEQHAINREAGRTQTATGFTIYMPQWQARNSADNPELRILGPKCPPGAKCAR